MEHGWAGVEGIEIETIDGVPIPFDGAALMLEMKQGMREKDTADRRFLQQLLYAKKPPEPGA